MSRPSPTTIEPATTRPRPSVHFTAEDGWINDPYGVVWADDRYHLFYQAVPGRVTWAPNCHWGHATSPDLVHWTEEPLALTPQEFEVGCWSGTVVGEVTPPLAFYTRIAGADWARGAVAVATGEPKLREWSTGPADLVVPDAPAELGVRTFRDPYVFRFRGQWVMIVGAGLADGSGAAVQYRSADLKTWTCDGLLASRSADRSDAVFTGAVWECPQLFPLGDSWVLVVSVWDDDVLHYVAAAVGEYDGRHFRPRSWQRLTYGSSAYATSAFVDREGRRCAISWLREEPQNDPRLTRRAGAHSVPAVVTRTDTGRLALWPHPNLDGATDRRVLDRAGDGETRVALGGQAVELRLVPSPGQRLVVMSGDAVVAELAFGATRPEVRIQRPGRADGSVPISGGRELRLVFDADLLEIFGAGGYGAFRIGSAEGPTAPAAISSPRSRP